MRPIIGLLAGFLLPVGAVVWIGVAVAEKTDPKKAGTEKSGFKGWKYPGAKDLSSSGAAGWHHAVLATTDGLDKVVKFYEKKTGEKLTPDFPGGSTTRFGAGEAKVFQDDSREVGAKVKERAVVVRILLQRAKGHDLTLVVSRAKGEDHTHIVLTYFGK